MIRKPFGLVDKGIHANMSTSSCLPRQKPLAAMAGIHKHFGGVEVLRNVRFEVFGGEVHVLAGENGAGKSTLIKILAGVHSDFQGAIEIDGRRVRPRSPLEAGRSASP